MGNLSKHFNREEFACNDECGYDTVDYELVIVLEDVRAHFGKPVHINRGTSCETHNDHIQLEYDKHYVAGSSKSQHLVAKGADFFIQDTPAYEVVTYLEQRYPGKYGIGRYAGRTHIDVRSKQARWSTI